MGKQYDISTQEGRTERARLAANAMWSRKKSAEDYTAHTEPARAAFLGRFETPEERTEYFRRLARRSVAARRNKAAAAE